MGAQKKKSPRKLKIILLTLIVITCGIIVTVFIGYRRILNKPDVLISSFKKDANLSLDRVRQTATKNGIKEWSLDARSAHYNDKNKQAFLTDISVIFFLKNGQQVNVTAKEGILKTDSSDIEASGNVLVINGQYKLNTQNIFYDHHRRLIFSKTPVKIWSDDFDLKADSITFDLNTNRTALKGNVKGIFIEKFQL